MNSLHRVWKQLLDRELGNKTETDNTKRWRPQLHIAPPVGWLNDPNGLCQYQGVYHAFYQFSPFEVNGGLKFWGHCTSRDLLHWEFQGVPLTPDQPFDCHGVYSGSALVEDGGLLAFYTGNVKKQGDYDFIRTGRESNTVLAVSRDGMTFEAKELLMKNEDYPLDVTLHVRDPKVWKQGEAYYMVQGARTKEDKGVVLVFESRDKKNWTYINRLETPQPFGYMWECPDLYELDGRTVLGISPQGLEKEGLRYANVYQSLACFLDGDFRAKAELRDFQELDGGFDFYAPQTFLAEDGRRIQIAWMGMPDADEFYTNRTVSDGWQHMLTLPRELSVQNGVLCQTPVRELDGWWNQERPFAGHFKERIAPCCELELQTGDGDVRITLAGGLTLRYEKREKIFWMEFTDKALGAGRTIRGREIERLTQLRILVDVSSVEVFLNGGTDVFSTRFYPEDGQYTAELEAADGHGRYRFHA